MILKFKQLTRWREEATGIITLPMLSLEKHSGLHSLAHSSLTPMWMEGFDQSEFNHSLSFHQNHK